MSTRERQIFEAAIELDGDARAEWLAEACDGNPELFERVSRLLAAHDQASDAPSRLVTPRPVTLEDPETIDDYRIMERIGEGGMGVVYLAEQTQPVRRRVALKIIKLGMDTKEVIARFESERQALALMNHPHIARILEAGATAQGRPYFVMEYVPGISITEYCDKMRFGVEPRLRLFMRVCRAVQHAHQKGVIHRDIKPSNILVRDEQGEAVPKVIDFGVAKATEQRLSELTFHTRFGFLIGTPEYMSPEQAEMTQLDVDTRSDVYSLGAVLYELLTGVRPFEFDGKNQAEMQRVIRGIEPETPSRRLTKLDAEQAGDIARCRSSTIESLSRALKGELGWITTRALAKNPARRYQGAHAFASDIERFLENQPVLAGPEGFVYRSRKFVRRHRAAFAGASLALIALIGGLTVASLGYVEASRERDEARMARDQAETVTQFLADMLAAADPAEQGKDVTVREVLDKASAGIDDQFVDRPLLQAQLLSSIGETYRSLGDLAAAESHLARRLAIYEEHLPADHLDRLDGQYELARVYHRQGRYTEAESLYRTTLEGRRRALGHEHPNTVNSMNNLALVYYLEGRNEEAGELWAEALSIDRRLRGSEHPDTLGDMNNLSLAYIQTGRYDEAEALLDEALDARRRVLGVEHPGTLMTGFNLAFLYSMRGRLAEAEQRLRDVAAISERVFGEEHGRTLLVYDGIGTALHKMGRLDEAEAMLRRTLSARRRALGEKHPQTLQSLLNLGKLLIDRRQYEEAEPMLRYAVDADTERLVSPNWRARFRAYYGTCLLALGRLDDAEPLLLEGYDSLVRANEESGLLFGRDLDAVLRSLVDLFERLDRPTEAAHYRKLLVERESSAADRAAS